MTTSILNDCLLLKNQPVEKLQEYFTTINLTVFDQIFQKFASQKEEAKQVVLFILCAYSEDSPLVIIRQDSRDEQWAICEYLDIPEYLRGNIVDRIDPEIRTAITDYLEQFAGYEFKTLMFLKIQYEDLNRDITRRIFYTTEEQEEKEIVFYYDHKEHMKALKELQNLSRAITQLEDRIKSLGKHEAIQDMKDWRNRGKGKTISMNRGGVSIEHSPLIKRKVV